MPVHGLRALLLAPLAAALRRAYPSAWDQKPAECRAPEFFTQSTPENNTNLGPCLREGSLNSKNRKFLAYLREVYQDVRVLSRAPTAEEASTWRSSVAVINEGHNQVFEGTTHYYAMISMLLPNLVHFVLEPLRLAGRSGRQRTMAARRARGGMASTTGPPGEPATRAGLEEEGTRQGRPRTMAARRARGRGASTGPPEEPTHAELEEEGPRQGRPRSRRLARALRKVNGSTSSLRKTGLNMTAQGGQGAPEGQRRHFRGRPRIILPREHIWTPCADRDDTRGPLQLLRRGEAAEVTYAHMRQTCRPAVEMLPSIFPDLQISFEEIPYCLSDGVCLPNTDPSPELNASLTVLFVPSTAPLACPDHDCGVVTLGCGLRKLPSLRRWMLPLGRPPVAPPNQITIVQRGLDAPSRKTMSYHYERVGRARVSNVAEIHRALEPLAAQWGYEVQHVVMEQLPIHEQISIMRKTRVLIGYEGAGLVNMLYFEEPQRSAVVELNSNDGRWDATWEYPTLARLLGTILVQYVFRCRDKPEVPVDPQPLVDQLAGFVFPWLSTLRPNASLNSSVQFSPGSTKQHRRPARPRRGREQAPLGGEAAGAVATADGFQAQAAGSHVL